MSIFENASRIKLRFSTPKGELSVEQLWDLPLQHRSGLSLDSLAIDLNNSLINTNKSFVNESTVSNKLLQLQFDIVKYIIDKRVKEKADVSAKLQVQETRIKLQELIANKKDEALSSKSLEELELELQKLSV